MKARFTFLLLIMVLLFSLSSAATPVINTIGNTAVTENSTLSFNITLANENINQTTFSFSSSPTMNGSSLVKVNNSLATFSWTPGFQAAVNNQATDYSATFSVNDTVNLCSAGNCSNSSASQAVVITVSNLNRPPVLGQIGNKTVKVGELLQFTVNGSDPDGDVLGFSTQTSLPSGASFNPSTRVFSWTPQSVGSFPIVFVVSDGTLFASETISVNAMAVPPDMTVSAIGLGSSGQKRSNPESRNENDFNVLVSGTMAVTNIGNEPISNLTISSLTPASGFSASSLNFTYSISQTTINQGESAIITLNARVPENLDAIDPSSVEERSINVASAIIRGFAASSGVTLTKTAAVNMQAKNNLRIKEMRITIDGDSSTLTNGDTVRNVRPGAAVSIEVQVENRFDTDDRVDMVDAEVRVKSNSDLDIDEDDSAGDIAPRKTKTVVIKFTIDSSAENTEYDFDVEATADDENGARHGQKKTFSIEVEREEHEISIIRTQMTPESVSCEATSELRVDVRNVGQNDEDSVFIRISSPDLKYGQVVGPLSIDQDSTRSSTFSIPILSNLTAGTKRITVESFYDGDKLSDRDAATLQLSRCGDSTTGTQPAQPQAPQAGRNDTVVVVQAPSEPVVAAETPVERRTSFFDSPYYIPVLVIANLLVLALAIFLISRIGSRD